MSKNQEQAVHGPQSGTTNVTLRRILGLLGTTSLTLATWSTAAIAQNVPQTEVLGEVTVTGTRVMRDGYEAPTPVSVLGVEEMRASPTTNLADSVVRLPALSGSRTSHNQAQDLSSGQGGANFLNLRGLGTTRTLVLMDGRRMVGASLATTASDVNPIPTALVERVEVVTGGASAAYGSDALAGVVNFVLNRDFVGVKGDVEGGITGKGDGGNYKASIAGGTRFGADRGHVMGAFEYAKAEAIPHNNRSWGKVPFQLISNPAYTPSNGEPQYLNARDVGSSMFADGGLITGCTFASGTPGPCPLRGTQFVEGGAPAPFEFGIVSPPLMIGGDWRDNRVDQLPSLTMRSERYSAFGRVSFDVTDNTRAYAELQWSSTRAANPSQLRPFDMALSIRADNAFLPESIRQEMVAAGISAVTLGTSNQDLPMEGGDHTRKFSRYALGMEGDLALAGSDWRWDLYAGRSEQDVELRAPTSRVTRFFRAALDAVFDDDGSIVCRVNIDPNPNNDEPGCVPYNVMGVGVNSREAVNYVIRQGHALQELRQDFFAASMSGEPFSSWAGPVSLALGAEHRRESVGGWASELDEANSFFAGNWHASKGDYQVTEGFLETVIPLAADQPFAKSLDFNGAVRWTDYSTSGAVTTWKLGATWSPIEDVRLRFTRSRDIRAPSLGELFNAGISGTTNAFDPVMNVTSTVQQLTKGNPNLDPEVADTTGVGIVLTPSVLPGFAVSVDYYAIEIEDAISTLGSTEIIRRCADGVTSLCPFITRNADGFVTNVSVLPQNILSQKATGYDVEMSYRQPLGSGDLALRALFTYFDSLETRDARTVQGAGVNTPSFGIGGGSALSSPRYRYLLSAAYRYDRVNLTLTMRGVSSGVYNNDFLECTSGCPTSTSLRPTINDNHIASVQYFDLAVNYKLRDEGLEAYVGIENLFDEDPPMISGTFGTGFIDGQANQANYDRLGRQFRAGMRFKF